MKCPIDDTQRVMSERVGIEIDYCPQCRGVWLDRGELDKIIERSTTQQPTGQNRPYADAHDSRHGEGRTSDGRGYDSHKKSKESWLGDLFG